MKKSKLKNLLIIPFLLMSAYGADGKEQMAPPPPTTTSTSACTPLPPDYPSPSPLPTELNLPSLWWAKEQYQKQCGCKLLDSWLVDANTLWINLIINRQVWSLLNYVERYQFVNRIGLDAQHQGFNIRVCNHQGDQLATYACTKNSCQIKLDASGKSGLTGNTGNDLFDN